MATRNREEFVANGYTGEPDYYLRFKNKVFLFESKDVVLTGDEKQSRNYAVLKKASGMKFYKIDSPGHVYKKAVLQLIENVRRVFDK